MKKITTSLLLLTAGVFTFGQDGQNMVENPGFEQIEGKIRREGAISAAVGWMSPTKAAADLFAAKVKDDFSTPKNVYGYEEPHGGENYAGIRVFSYNDKEPRQYLSTKLKLPLRKGALYCVKFYINLAEGSKYASNNIGINFAKKQYNIDENKSIMVPTDVKHRDNPVFNARFGWEEICATYEAQGGEKFLTIGNFTSNGETENERLKKDRDFTGQQVVSAYYFIDDISVVMIDSESECDCKIKEHEVKTEFIYSVSAPSDIEDMSPTAVMALSELYFAHGKDELTTGDYAHLKNIVTVMKNNPDEKLVIVAHMDKEEAADERLANIDQKRGQTVKEYLVENGVKADRISIKTMGANEPVDESGSDIAKAKNRRVKFRLE